MGPRKLFEDSLSLTIKLLPIMVCMRIGYFNGARRITKTYELGDIALQGAVGVELVVTIPNNRRIIGRRMRPESKRASAERNVA